MLLSLADGPFKPNLGASFPIWPDAMASGCSMSTDFRTDSGAARSTTAAISVLLGML